MDTEKEQVIKEILSTEQKYVNDLETVLVVYRDPLLKSDFISSNTVNQIFKNLNVILNINKSLLKQFSAYYEEFVKLSGFYSGGLSPGKIFLKLAPFLKTYTDYCNNYENVATVIRTERKTNKKFDEYLAKLERSHKENGGLGLTSYLITPVQRIPRYSLLLRELIKVSDPSMDDYENLELAIEKVKQSTEYMNTKLKIMDNQKKLLAVQKRLEAGIVKEEEVIQDVSLTPKNAPLTKGGARQSTGGKEGSTTPDNPAMNGIKKGEDKGGKKRISGTALTSLFNKFKRQGNSKTKSQSTTPQTVSPPEEGEEEPLPGLNIIRPHRLFVFEGRIIVFPNENDLSSNDEEQKKFEQIVFVFSDILMFCTSGKQVNSLVYISEIEFLPSSGTIDSVPWVRDLTDTLFQYVGIKETLTFKAKDEKEKKKWIENLDKTIEINLRKKFDDQEAPSKADPLYTPSQAYVYMKQQEEKEEEGEKEIKETTPKIEEEEEVKFTVDDEDDLKVDLVVENEVVTPQELSKIVSASKVYEEVSEQVVSEKVVQEVVSTQVVSQEELERNEQQKIMEEQTRLKLKQQEEEEKKKQEKLQEEKRQTELKLQEEKRKEQEEKQALLKLEEEKRKEEEKQTLLKLEEEKREQEEKQALLKLEEEKRRQEEKQALLKLEEKRKEEELKKQEEEKLEAEKKQEELKKQEEEEKIVEEEEEEEAEEIHTKSSTQDEDEKEEKRKRNGKKRKSQTVNDDASFFEEKKVTTPPKKQYKEVEDVSQIEVLKKRLHSDNKYSNKLPTPPTKSTTPVPTDESKMIEEIEKKENISLKGTKPNDLEQLLNAYKDSQSSVTFVSEKAKINYEAQIIQIKRNLGKKKSRIGSVIDTSKRDNSVMKEIEEKEDLSLSYSRQEDIDRLLNAYRDSKSPIAFVSEKAQKLYEEILEQVKRDNAKAKRPK